MTWMIGIDEAGYGPNLGPLVVGATAWQVEEASGPVDLYARLAEVITDVPDKNKIAIADSKVLYKPRKGLRLLERAVLTTKPTTTRWQHLFDAADPTGLRHKLPWYADYDHPLPIDATTEEIAKLKARFQNGCEAAGVKLLDTRAHAVFPQEFNDLTTHHGTKGATLSHISIALLKKVLNNITPNPQPPTHITFDKHGGRNRYAELLQHHFPDQQIETLQESRAASHYQWGPPENRVHITFRTRGEEELPTALASMIAKYHRELAMQAFNAFWSEKVPNLRPTAGYPMDAKRFISDISTKQQELKIKNHTLWRNR